jgi:hypothetical protein
MARNKRKDVLAAIRVAGHHGDYELARLLYIKNWVSLSAFRREFETGAALRQSGVPCECSVCSNPYPLEDVSSGLRPSYCKPLEYTRLPQIPAGLLIRR